MAISKGLLRVAAVVGLPLAALCQTAPTAASIPSDPLEMVTGTAQALSKSSGRDAALQLLTRARGNYDLKSAAAVTI